MILARILVDRLLRSEALVSASASLSFVRLRLMDSRQSSNERNERETMISITRSRPEHRQGPGAIRLSLYSCETKDEIIRAFGKRLKGRDSVKIKGNSLDALVDVMSDWFIEGWGKEKRVYVSGHKRVFEHGEEFALKVAQCLNDAFTDALHDRALNHDCDGIVDEIHRVHIYLVLD